MSHLDRDYWSIGRNHLNCTQDSAVYLLLLLLIEAPFIYFFGIAFDNFWYDCLTMSLFIIGALSGCLLIRKEFKRVFIRKFQIYVLIILFPLTGLIELLTGLLSNLNFLEIFLAVIVFYGFSLAFFFSGFWPGILFQYTLWQSKFLKTEKDKLIDISYSIPRWRMKYPNLVFLAAVILLLPYAIAIYYQNIEPSNLVMMFFIVSIVIFSLLTVSFRKKQRNNN